MSNTVTVKPDGPLIACGNIRIISTTGEVVAESNEVYLCRCGASKNKPFCDGTHKNINFSDAGQFIDNKSEQLVTTSGENNLLDITCRDNAMLLAKGQMTIRSLDGNSKTCRNKAAFCRCGASNNKPFCDASHKSK